MCHVLEPQKQTIEPLWLAREFFHGMADTPTPGVAKTKLWGATDDLRFHFPHMGVVLTAVCQLAKLFGCSAELEVVTSERNRRTAAAGLAGYAKWLYDDARIVASVWDSGLPIQDPILDLTRGRKLRLLQMDPIVRKLVNSCGSRWRMRAEERLLDVAAWCERVLAFSACPTADPPQGDGLTELACVCQGPAVFTGVSHGCGHPRASGHRARTAVPSPLTTRFCAERPSVARRLAS